MKRRIYLTLERGRDIALRNLLRKVFVTGGFEDVKEGEEGKPRVRRTRIPVKEFGAAISLGGKEVMDGDEVECLIANMIYKVCPPFPSIILMGKWMPSSKGMPTLSQSAMSHTPSIFYLPQS